jgi:hypothetical protein
MALWGCGDNIPAERGADAGVGGSGMDAAGGATLSGGTAGGGVTGAGGPGGNGGLIDAGGRGGVGGTGATQAGAGGAATSTGGAGGTTAGSGSGGAGGAATSTGGMTGTGAAGTGPGGAGGAAGCGNPSDCACSGGACISTGCNTSVDCTGGQICGISVAHTCGACGGDSDCVGDSYYGAGDICYQGGCVTGNCHATSSECVGANAGLICGVATPEACGSCTTDTQCKNDPFYGAGTICDVSTGQCTSAACTTNDLSCSANGADFCCGNVCVSGNCCNTADCLSQFGGGYTCIKNTCTTCDQVSGNAYYVDPVNGSDAGATGSGMAAGVSVAACAFKTLTHAMTVISANGAATGTKVIILGTAGATTNLAAAETYPITVAANVTVTNAGGPVTIVLPSATNQAIPSNVSGFILFHDKSGISGNTSVSAPLVIEGNGNLSGIAVSATGTGTVSLANVTIQNTRGHGMSVSNGTVNVGQGVVIQGAGAASAGILQDGLDITGGVVNIAVPAGGTPAQFINNTQRGIEVTGSGSLNIAAIAATTPVTGKGTVIVSGNTDSGIYINQTPGGTGAACFISGLVSWNNGTCGGSFFGGSAVTVRGSVFGANARYGLLIGNAGSGGTATQRRDISKIDLGNQASGGAGNNWFQFPAGVMGRNVNAGLCVSLGGTTTATMLAAGNEWTTGPVGSPNLQTQVNCATTAATVTKANNWTTNGNSCANGVAIGHGQNTGVAAYILDGCN